MVSPEFFRLVFGMLRPTATLSASLNLWGIRCPVLAVVGKDDNIVPAAATLIDQVGSSQKDTLEMPGGHASLIVGRQASARLWPALGEWLAALGGNTHPQH